MTRRALDCRLLLVLATMMATTVGAQSTTERVSVNSDGVGADFYSSKPSISSDGRFVVFASEATNLVPGDTNDWRDIFVRDRQSGQTDRVSVASDGSQADRYSADPAMSRDGRYIVFSSKATNLVVGDSNSCNDIFVHDRSTGETRRVSVATDGTQADGHSFHPKISGDGRFVVFDSDASNLGGDVVPNIFVHDLQTHVTELVTDDSNGPPTGSHPAISADGRWVAYRHQAFDCAPPYGFTIYAYVKDRLTNLVTPVSVDSNGNLMEPCHSVDGWGLRISADGRFVVFSADAPLVADDTNGYYDVYVHDLDAGTTERVSLTSDGDQIDRGCSGYSISDDGRFVPLVCWPDGLIPPDDLGPHGLLDRYVFLRDRVLGTTVPISLAYRNYPGEDAGGRQPSISGDGTYIAYSSLGGGLVPGDANYDSDVFVWDNSRIFSGTFESGNDCHWSDSQGGLGCPGGIAATGFITAYPRDNDHELVDSVVFMLNDGVNPRTTFEIEAAGNGVEPGNVPVNLTGAPYGAGFAAYALPIVLSVINAAPNLDITPTTLNDSTLLLTNDQPGVAGNRRITGDFHDRLVFSYEGMSGGVDPRP